MVKTVAPDPQRREARGAGLNDMFSFHKHGQWSPQGARTGGKDGAQSGRWTGSADRKCQSFWLASDLQVSWWRWEGGLCQWNKKLHREFRMKEPEAFSGATEKGTRRKGSEGQDPKTHVEGPFTHQFTYPMTLSFGHISLLSPATLFTVFQPQ